MQTRQKSLKNEILANLLYHFKIWCLDFKKMERIEYSYLNHMLDGYSYMWDLGIVILAVKYHWEILDYFEKRCHWLNMIIFGFCYIIWGFKFYLACQWAVELSMYHLSSGFTTCVDGSDFSSLIMMELLTCRTFGNIVNFASWNFCHNEKLKERQHIYIKLQLQEGKLDACFQILIGFYHLCFEQLRKAKKMKKS